jgi:hypothetical protein
MCLTLPEILPTGYLYLSRRKDVNTFEFQRGISSISGQIADEVAVFEGSLGLVEGKLKDAGHSRASNEEGGRG